MRTQVKCKEKGCFAHRNGYCTLLDTPFPEGRDCTFRKPIREITNGKYYPYDHDYQNIFSGWKKTI